MCCFRPETGAEGLALYVLARERERERELEGKMCNFSNHFHGKLCVTNLILKAKKGGKLSSRSFEAMIISLFSLSLSEKKKDDEKEREGAEKREWKGLFFLSSSSSR